MRADGRGKAGVALVLGYRSGMTPGEILVREVYTQCVDRWPRFVVDWCSFGEHCWQMLGESCEIDVQLHGADLYLCCACSKGDRVAMEILAKEGASVAESAIRRVNPDPEFVRETLQALWDELLSGAQPKIGRYAGRGPLRAWLRVVATRTAIDRCRARRVEAARHVELLDELATDGGDPETETFKHRYAASFERALREAVAELSVKDRALLRLHVEERCSIDDLGRAYGVHRATAARWLEAARRRVFDSVRARLSLGARTMTETELESVARLVRSGLEWNGLRGSREMQSHHGIA